MSIVKKLFLVALLGAALGPTLAACNTMEGMGQDVQSGGKAIEKSADQVQKKM